MGGRGQGGVGGAVGGHTLCTFQTREIRANPRNITIADLARKYDLVSNPAELRLGLLGRVLAHALARYCISTVQTKAIKSLDVKPNVTCDTAELALCALRSRFVRRLGGSGVTSRRHLLKPATDANQGGR